MAVSSKSRTRVALNDAGFATGFDVTVRHTIGHVSFEDRGDLNPREAAFLLIARHGEEGTYEFPGHAEGMTERVIVEWPQEVSSDAQ